MTSYETIEELFLRKINDILMAKDILDRPDFAKAELDSYLKSSIAKNKLAGDVITFNDLGGFIEEDLEYFSIDYYAECMITEWLHPVYYSTINTSQLYGAKEQNFYSQANHMSALRDMYNDSIIRSKKIKRDYGNLHNPYLEN